MERVEAEQLFARALDDVWHLVQPVGDRCWRLECTGRAAQIDECETGMHARRSDADAAQAPIELELCEACLRRLK